MNERRQTQRAPCAIHTVLSSVEVKDRVCCTTIDLSERGGRVASNGAYVFGTDHIYIELTPTDRQKITVLGRIEWTDGEWVTSQTVGVRFLAMMPNDRQRLRQVIEELKEGTRL